MIRRILSKSFAYNLYINTMVTIQKGARKQGKQDSQKVQLQVAQANDGPGCKQGGKIAT
jgi:hypothetical protein